MERRLAAILAADVVGYSALIGRDEERTIRALKGHLGVLEPMVGLHSGRIFKTTGDGFLAEFASAVDAVSCADAMQARMADRNGGEPEDFRLDFRMGVHAGDVIVDGDDILGDDVNIAARLEGVSSPGGVAVSARVRDGVVDKLEITFDDLGLKTLKNIAAPIRVYAAGPRRAAPAAAPISLPDKPSVAVLPFNNMSAAAEDDYFADGMTEDIITALSHVPWIFVIARNSSFTYKGLSVDIRKVGRELGVRYVLEGSVRRSGDRLRITGQLIDAETGAHIWAERYDGVVEDIFDLQDRISAEVVTAIAPEIRSAEIQRGLRKPPENLDAYDMYLRAQDGLHRGRWEEANDWLTSAIDLAPDFAKAKALRAWNVTAVHLQSRQITPEMEEAGLVEAREALDLAPNDPEVMAYAGYTVAFLTADPEGGLVRMQEATRRSPSFAWAWASGSLLSAYCARSTQAHKWGEKALRLSPRDPMAYRVYVALALAAQADGDYEALLDAGLKGAALNPRLPLFHRYQAMALWALGRHEEAAAPRARAMEMAPQFRVNAHAEFVMRKVGVAEVQWRSAAKLMREAGFPE